MPPPFEAVVAQTRRASKISARIQLAERARELTRLCILEFGRLQLSSVVVLEMLAVSLAQSAARTALVLEGQAPGGIVVTHLSDDLEDGSGVVQKGKRTRP